MIKKEKAERGQMEFVYLENMVPGDHLLRKIEAAVNFDKIYEMRYTNYRGLSQVTKWVRLKFAAMNLKKYALHKWNELFLRFYFAIFDKILSSGYFCFAF